MNAIRRQLQTMPHDLISLTANKRKDMERLQQGIKRNEMKKEKWRKDQMDLFEQRLLFDGDTYEQQMLAIKQHIQNLDDDISILEKQRISLDEQRNECTAMEHLLKEFRELEGVDMERTRVLLHEVIQQVTLSDRHLDVQYRYDFGC
jgi:site-specific DNA recombinase